MEGFYITVKNGLLDPKHVRAMGGDRNIGTVWLFLWLLDKMTIIDHEKGEGKVLGGKPIKFDEVKKDLQVSRATYGRWIKMLTDGGYITTTRTPYGLCIIVHKAYKVFGQKAERSRTRDTSGSAVGDTSDPPSETHLPPSGDTSNKTGQYDRTKDSSRAKREWPDPFTSKDLTEYLNYILETGTPANQIIVEFMGWKGVGVDTGALRIKNRKEVSAVLGRYARTANQLAKTYPQAEVFRKIAILGEHAPFDWQLENVLKYMAYSDEHLAETMKKMKGRQ